MNDFPPLDTHAHVDAAIPTQALLELRAVVLVATRSLSEYSSASGRKDPLAIWGVGVHPGVPAAADEFDDRTLRRHLQQTPLLSEIGLERRSRVSLPEQRRIFAAALDAHDDMPCIASVHSSGNTADVVDMLQGHRCSSIILHWWRGAPDETRAAIELGCYFSFNPRDSIRGSSFDLIPPGRVLTETDHPYGDRGEPDARPGLTTAIERRMNSTQPDAARRQIWSNFRTLVDAAGALDRLPTKIAGIAYAAGG